MISSQHSITQTFNLHADLSVKASDMQIMKLWGFVGVNHEMLSRSGVFKTLMRDDFSRLSASDTKI